MSVEVQVKNKDDELVTIRRWPIDTYKKWIREYGRLKSTRQKNQVKRWREVVERNNDE